MIYLLYDVYMFMWFFIVSKMFINRRQNSKRKFNVLQFSRMKLWLWHFVILFNNGKVQAFKVSEFNLLWWSWNLSFVFLRRKTLSCAKWREFTLSLPLYWWAQSCPPLSPDITCLNYLQMLFFSLLLLPYLILTTNNVYLFSQRLSSLFLSEYRCFEIFFAKIQFLSTYFASLLRV